MKILYDAQTFLNQKTGGISRYHYELLKGMKSLGHEVSLPGKFIKNKYLLADKDYRKHYIHDPFALFTELNLRMLKRSVAKGTFDIFHPSKGYGSVLQSIPDNKSLVFTIHDMILEKYFGKKAPIKQEYARRADKIIAVSNTTKKDVMEIFGIEADKIDVVYHGSSLQIDPDAKLPANLPENYILYVGNRDDSYKNFVASARGVAPLLNKFPDLHLVCAGRRQFSKSELTLFNSLRISQQTQAYQMVDDDVLAILYAHAGLFIFPSLYEGFGIPILEAWSCNAPLVLSDNDCFREVAGDAGYYFNPFDHESITYAVEKVLNSPSLQNELREKGQNRLTQFSWERSVRQTNDIYRSLIE